MKTKAPLIAALLGALVLAPIAPTALAQDASAGTSAPAAVDQALMDTGKTLFGTNCAQCHQPDGTGNPPTFPALAGNPHLSDLSLIANNIHSGKGVMPAFPNLSAADIAALATYIRNSWGNSFGGVSESDVTAILGANSATATPASGAHTIWDGVYTQAQVDRGMPVVIGTCSKCHGHTLNGAGQPDQPPSPAIARAGFLGRWDGRTLGALFDYLKSTMPKDNPGQLTDQQYADAIAVMLSMSKAPAGASELAPDSPALAAITITKAAK